MGGRNTGQAFYIPTPGPSTPDNTLTTLLIL
uniref:Uncharacterized protein n=1 Tax=Anguilla anguilla TaxID=7936 RepID=A0A0E9UC87_ANGAN